MHQEKRRDNTHISYYVDCNGFKLKPEDVNFAFCYTLLPYKDIQEYGDYWAILRRRPGAAALAHNTRVHAEQTASLQRSSSRLRTCRTDTCSFHPSRYWLESPLNQFKVEYVYPYFSYFMGNKVNVKRINKDLNLNQIPYKTEQVLDEKFSSKLDKQGNKRSNGKEVNPKDTMATLLRLQIPPNDHKATLDAYLHKLEGHTEDLKDVLARIPFVVTHKVASAQLSRLTGLQKTIRHITDRPTPNIRVVNNLPALINDDPNVGVTFDGHEPITSPRNEPAFPNEVNADTDDEQDRQDPESLGGNF
jgi:hypothetical protein